MSKVDELIHSINSFIRKESDDEDSLIDTLPDFEGKDKVENMVEEFETIIARLLRKQRKFILNSVKAFIAKDDTEMLENLLAYLREQIFNEDTFTTELSQESIKFFNQSVSEFATVIMDAIDQDIQLEVLSNRTITWIEEWSEELGELMKNTAHEAVEKILINGISEGHGIAKVELELSNLPQFSRERARATAITEVLTASSVAQQESYTQSPAVTGKRWKHSGAKYSKPRENHMMLDGTVVGVDDYFVIPGSNELAQYPRDVSLSPKERINCHCTSGPEVDQAILGLSKEEKEQIREEALAELDGISTDLGEDVTIRNRQFHPVEDIDAWSNHVSEQWKNSLTISEQQAINIYTSETYSEINTYLREGKLSYLEKHKVDELVSSISSGLDKFNLEENIVTYRGNNKNFFEGIPVEILPGRKFNEKAFLSTSLSESVVTDNFAGDMFLSIHVPSGVRGAFINSVSEFEDIEYEFLLDHNSTLVIKEAIYKGKVLYLTAEVEIDV